MLSLILYMVIQTILIAIVITIFVTKNEFKENTYDCMKTLYMKYPFLNNVYLLNGKGNVSIAKYSKLKNKIYV